MKKIKNQSEIDPNNVPHHIGFIMDGNGRWATKRGLPRTAGHRAGVDALRRVLEACRDFGVKVVSVYAFSTENYQRSDAECKYIFDLVAKFATDKTKSLIEHNTKLNICGDLDFSDKLDSKTKKALLEAQEATKDCNDNVLNLCFSYGGHHEIVQAVNKALANGVKVITEQDIQNNLYTSKTPNPDLIVRASGEHRLSNFLIWQSAYAEFYFPTTHWPDFDHETVKECILEYQKRNRRFGNV